MKRLSFTKCKLRVIKYYHVSVPVSNFKGSKSNRTISGIGESLCFPLCSRNHP